MLLHTLTIIKSFFIFIDSLIYLFFFYCFNFSTFNRLICARSLKKLVPSHLARYTGEPIFINIYLSFKLWTNKLSSTQPDFTTSV